MVNSETKNRKILSFFVCLAIAALLTACGSPIVETPAEDEFVTAKNSYQENIDEAQEIPIAQITNLPAECEAYTLQISQYYIPLEEHWAKSVCSQCGLCDILPDCVGADSLNGLGFCCMDLNSDGINELLICSTDTNNPIVLELWAIVNEKPKLIARSGEESKYYLRKRKKTDSYILENSTGLPENETARFYFTFNGVHLEYLWDIFPGISSSRQSALNKALEDLESNRILPSFTAYSALNRVQPNLTQSAAFIIKAAQNTN